MDDVVVVVVGRGGLKAGVLRLGAGGMRSGGMVGSGRFDYERF